MNGALAWAVLIPLVGAVACLAPRPVVARMIVVVTAAATSTAAVAVTWSVATRGVVRHLVGAWGASLGIELRADGIAAVMLLAVAAVSALVIVWALGTRRREGRDENRFLSLGCFAWASLNALVLSADIFNLYVALELTTLGAVGLVATGGSHDAIRAALRYLLFALPGSLFYLLGVALLYGQYATLDLAVLGARIAPTPSTGVALALMVLGLALKSALVPLHGWLPPAYVSSSAAASALVAGLLGKGAFYVLLRLWIAVMPPELEPRAGQLLGVLGAAAILWGSLVALEQRRLKSLIAYSSVAQLGYLFVAFAVATPAAWSGAIYLTVSHAAAKASMFLSAATIQRALGRDDLAGLARLSRELPLTFFSLALAGLTLMGVPPSGGFVAKWLLVRAALEDGQWWLAAVLVGGGLLAAGYVFRIVRSAFLPAGESAEIRRPPRAGELVPLALALLSVGVGFAPAVVLALLRVGMTP